MVQFKAFFNEWFLHDTSRKVRNGNTVKRILQNVTYLGWVSNGNFSKTFGSCNITK
ncbi:MAG: hypothetical protein HFJ52_07405 [Clostridia bacterium]|nr:hypothetical protein [Clostridia bacterium]